MFRKFLALAIVLVLPLILISCSSDDSDSSSADTGSTGSVGTDFIKADGNGLVVGPTNSTIFLRGVNFREYMMIDSTTSDWVDYSISDNDSPVTGWFNDGHIAKAAEIGFNVVRLALNYRYFEDDSNPGVYKDSGWTFLDNYISVAKANGVYLILDMHIPPGGLQTIASGAVLWDDSSNSDRLVAIWGAIASRYADETQIAGYDILNEPSPSTSADQWKTLAQDIVDEIRTVDTNHLIIVEQVVTIVSADGTYGNWDLAEFQFLVNDDNVMYDFHYYQPMSNYQHLSDWTLCGGVGSYPDPTVNEIASDGVSMACDKNYLEYDLGLWLAFYENNNVPVNCGEWGGEAYNIALVSLAGGGAYITDMFDLFGTNGVNWQYYSIGSFYTDSDMTTPDTSVITLFDSTFSLSAKGE